MLNTVVRREVSLDADSEEEWWTLAEVVGRLEPSESIMYIKNIMTVIINSKLCCQFIKHSHVSFHSLLQTYYLSIFWDFYV